jgi:hypothetical protein
MNSMQWPTFPAWVQRASQVSLYFWSAAWTQSSAVPLVPAVAGIVMPPFSRLAFDCYAATVPNIRRCNVLALAVRLPLLCAWLYLRGKPNMAATA